MILALVPVKDLWQAKQRLAGLLSAAERRALCLAMLEDVLGALRAARRLDGILVFSPDEDALAMSRRLGVAAVREPRGRGQSEAVAAALPLCQANGATTLLTIPVDTPLLTGEDIDALIAFWHEVALPPPSAVIVPSSDGTGTNALLLTPPDALPPRFGPDSFARHVHEAEQRNVVHRRFVLPRLGLDIDSPADLAAFLATAERAPQQSTSTYQHLRGAGIAERCRARTL